MISNALTPEMQRRLLLLARYLQALSASDLETASKILNAAERDEVLERMIVEANALYQQPQFLENQPAELAEADRQLVSLLLASLEADSMPGNLHKSRQTSSTPLPLSRRKREQARWHVHSPFGILAAVLLCVILLGSFLTFTAFYHHTTPSLVTQTGSAGITPTATAVPKNPWQRVPVPELQRSLFLGGVAAISANDAWAISTESEEARLLHWNGQQWRLVPGVSLHGASITFTGITATASNDIWVVGDYIDSGGPGKGVKILAEHWDGQHWSLKVKGNVPTLGTLNAVTAISPTNVWAVGDDISVVNDTPTSLVLHWDGQQWHAVPHPLMETLGRNGPNEAEFSAISALSANDIWMVGNVSIDHPNASAANELKPAIEHWDGQQWQVVTSPDPGGIFDVLNAVTVLSANDVWAVGATDQTVHTEYGQGQNLIEHWNGKKWRIIASSQSPQKLTLTGITAVSPDDVWAVGITHNGVQNGVLAHWDGQRWSMTFPMDTPSGFLAVMHIPGSNEIWVLGPDFTMYGPR
jgi:hypothetical protein